MELVIPPSYVPGNLVRTYVHAATSDNTRRAYRSDLRHFLEWGGTVPASDVMVADYLARHAGLLSVATLARRVASISKAHAAGGLPSPARSELVRSTLRGIRRTHGQPQRRARPLTKEDLFSVLATTRDGPRDARDRALLLVGFAGAFRRSELVAIDCADVEPVKQGVVVHVHRSKTDQEGAGRKVGIPPPRAHPLVPRNRAQRLAGACGDRGRSRVPPRGQARQGS